MTNLGNALIVAGVAVILISLFLAYSLYQSLPNLAPVPFTTNANVTASSAAGALVNNISATVAQESYIILKIIIFFLVASIGYKLAHLGIDANKAAPNEAEKEEEEEMPARKGK